MEVKMKLTGKKFAILATDGFEQSELTSPMQAIKENGGEVQVVSLKDGKIKGWQEDNWGEEIDVDISLESANPEDYDGLILPGGVINPDRLRKEEKAIHFVKSFFKESKQKPVAAICHGPWTLINAGVAGGKRLTSYESIKEDLKNAGAEWVDAEVVVDSGLVTSRNPGDLEAFNAKMIEEFSEGIH